MQTDDHATVTESHSDDHADSGHSQHDLLVVGGYLLVLTLATFVTHFMPAKIWPPTTNILFVLMIAVCKASLVVGFFMHYKYEKAWKYFLTIPPCILGVAMVFALLPDMAMHTWPHANWH